MQISDEIDDIRTNAFLRAVTFARHPRTLRQAGYTSLTNFILSEQSRIDRLLRETENDD